MVCIANERWVVLTRHPEGVGTQIIKRKGSRELQNPGIWVGIKCMERGRNWMKMI